MKLSDVSVKRPVAVLMLFLIIILLGAVSSSRLQLDLLPQLDLPMALAITSYEGVGPEEIENIITRPIENVLGTVNGIENIHSTSSLGSSLVFVEFAWGTDMNFAINQMREKIDLIAAALPSGAGKTTLFKLDPNMMPIMVLGLAGEMDLDALDRLANDVVKPRLERVNGVASVTVEGGVQREIRISCDPQRLQAYGMSLEGIISYLRLENRNTSAGTVEEGLREHVVRLTGEFKDIQEIENLQLPLAGGGLIRLAELARVEDTFKDKSVLVFMDGMPGIQISLQKQTDANTVSVSNEVNKEIQEIEKYLPAGASIITGFDQAEYIRLSINNVINNALLGAFLAMFVLLLFLRNLRSTLIIGTAIPISVIATFILMFFGGLTLNIISLGGLALGIGMMVDNAIVILENIYRHRQEGYSRLESATRGANEVGVAITASTLTTIVVFLPIVYVEGMASQIFKPLALTVSFSLLASLLVALTLVPMLSSKILKVDRSLNGEENSRRRVRLIGRLADSWYVGINKLGEKYRKVLHWSINNKKKVVLLSGVLLVVSLALLPMVGMEFIPAQDTGEYIINIALPNGTAMRETQRVAELVESYLEELPEHEWTFHAIGTGGGMIGGSANPERAVIQGRFKDKSERQRSSAEILDELRKKCAAIPGAKISINTQDAAMMGGAGTPVNITLTGDNLEVLQAFAEAVADRIGLVEGVREAKTDFEEGRPELHLKLNRQKADLYGINGAQLANLVTTAINGSTATKLRSGGEEIDVTVILEEEYRENVNDLKTLVIPSPSGALIPLGEVADFEITTGPTQINRLNQSRQVSVTSNIIGRDLGSVMKDIQLAVQNMNIPAGIQIEYGGSNKEMLEAFADLALALLLAVLLVYMILASQYESLLYPFVIMFSLPPTITGVIFALLLTGRTFNVPAFIGLIMLAGIVVNNAIVLVDYINTLRRRDGMSRKDAILKAGPTRLRPILMTTLTTILGLVPLLLGRGEGAEMSAPLATAIFGGLTFSTLITLLLVPCMYIILEDVKEKVLKLFKRRPPGILETPAGGE